MSDPEPVTLDRGECERMGQALRVFAALLVEDRRRSAPGKDLPADVTEQARRLNLAAEWLDGMGGMECSFRAFLVAGEREKPYLPLSLDPAGWRGVAAALSYLAERLRAASDKPNADQLHGLADKAAGLAAGVEGTLRLLRELQRGHVEDERSSPRP